MKTVLPLIALFPAIVCAETIQQRFASESNMCVRLSQGMGLTAASNRLEVAGWSTPTNLVIQSVNWVVNEDAIDEYDNCRLISLSLCAGTTNITADVRLCDDSETALFSTLLPEVAFSSMDPLKQIPDYLLETGLSGSKFLFRRRPDDPVNPPAPDVGRFDYLIGNVSVLMQGPLDLRTFPTAILRSGGVNIPDEPEPQDPNPDSEP